MRMRQHGKPACVLGFGMGASKSHYSPKDAQQQLFAVHLFADVTNMKRSSLSD